MRQLYFSSQFQFCCRFEADCKSQILFNTAYTRLPQSCKHSSLSFIHFSSLYTSIGRHRSWFSIHQRHCVTCGVDNSYAIIKFLHPTASNPTNPVLLPIVHVRKCTPLRAIRWLLAVIFTGNIYRRALPVSLEALPRTFSGHFLPANTCMHASNNSHTVTVTPWLGCSCFSCSLAS